MIKGFIAFTWKFSIFAFVIMVLVGCTTSQTRSSSTSKISKGSTSIAQEQFYGVWRNIRGESTLNVNLSKDSWIATYTDGNSYYTIAQLTWIPAKNDDPATKDMYPEGYYITGTASLVYNVTLTPGEQRTYTIYLNKDKTAFLRRDTGSTSFVFTKVE
jgi:hypothetical protein